MTESNRTPFIKVCKSYQFSNWEVFHFANRHHPLITLRSEGVGVVGAQRNHHRVYITKQRNIGGNLENSISA
jgi:hypothetical protein